MFTNVVVNVLVHNIHRKFELKFNRSVMVYCNYGHFYNVYFIPKEGLRLIY